VIGGLEACGLRVEDIDFLRAIVHPKVQYPARPLKTKTSKTPVPVPASLIEQCAIQVAAYGRHETLLTGEDERQLSPWAIERVMRKARSEIKSLPAGLPQPTTYGGDQLSRHTSKYSSNSGAGNDDCWSER
jgi:hypothetical protein